MLVLRSIVAWLLLTVLAVLNGLFREVVLLKVLPRPAAFLLSGLLLSSLVLVVAIVLARWLRLDTPSRCVRVGSLWVGLTVVFEFGFGGLVEGLSWREMLAAYTFKDGNLWPLVLVVTFFAPSIAGRIRGPGRVAHERGA